MKIFSLLLFFTSAAAWHDVGHIVTAEVAKTYLTPKTLKECERLIRLWEKDYPRSSEFATSSVWADDIKCAGNNSGLREFDAWHFTNIPYDPQHTLTEKSRQIIEAKLFHNNLVWSIESLTKNLATAQLIPFEKALVLRFLIHFIGDVHQPLHVTSGYSPQFTEGDKGGLLYKIVLPDGESSLHEFWDGCLNLYPFETVGRPLTKEGKKKIRELAALCVAEFPLEKAKEENLLNLNYASWAEESFGYVPFCYSVPLGSAPTDAYIQKGQAICKRQLALAGFRMAYALNSLFDP